MTQVLVPTSLGLPVRFMPDGLPLANNRYPSLVISSAPPGSKLKNQVVSAQPSATSWNPNPERYYDLTFDSAGIYGLAQLGGGSFSVLVEVAARFTRKLSTATVAIHVGNGVVVGTPTITADRTDAIATRAATASGVRAALSALVGMTPTQLSATGWPALESAWSTAIASPPSLPNESSATGALLSAGWSKS